MWAEESKLCLILPMNFYEFAAVHESLQS